MNFPLQFEVENESKWTEVTNDLWQSLHSYRIWLLEGDLGSGKTTFVRHLIRHITQSNPTSSPTYSIVNEYDWNSEQSRIFHLDLYRLNSSDEVFDLGIEDILDSGSLILIEWPDLVKPFLDETYITLNLSISGSGRHVTVNPTSP